jgi:hypothetical protein
MKEIHRVLKSGGVLVGQIPNMYLPIEIHSKLPLQQYLPRVIGDSYCRQFSPEPWREKGVDWFRVGPKNLISNATRAGFKDGSMYGANYPSDTIPRIFWCLGFFFEVVPRASISILLNDLASKWRELKPYKVPKSSSCSL